MHRPPLAYRAAAALAVPAVPLVLRDPRQRAAHQARLDAPREMERWANVSRDPSRPLIWFHAPSVGEGLQARAVMACWHRLVPNAQVVYTHYSPSAETFAAQSGADYSGYLGYDRPEDVRRMLDAAAPDLLAFTKLDLWPQLAVDAAGRGVRVAMIAATVSSQSGRLKWPARTFASSGYAALDLAGAISADDADRLARLGCRSERIVVTGDPRIDSAIDVAAAASSIDTLLGVVDPAITLVAGSTWPADEEVVLGAFVEVRRKHPTARLVMVPHQPSASHLHGIEALARRLGLPQPVRLSSLARHAAPPMIAVDRTGVLATLYRAGAIAYVGGGFGSHGIHSVLEPAAMSLPVVIGPNDRDSRDARLLERSGALTRLRQHQATEDLATLWNGWIERPETAVAAGRAARAALDVDRGAAQRSAELLVGLLKK